MPTRLVAVLLAAALQSSCLLLPGYEETGCGDSILGVDEDCDGRHVPAGGTCGAPESEHACHYICGGDDGAVCPAGWGCGLDGRCYQPRGSFEDPDPGVFLPIRVSAVSDVDGDGYADLMGHSDTTLSVRFSDGAGQFGDGFVMSIPRPTGPLWFAPLDDDALTDALIPLGPALLAFAGQSARELDSFLFPSITFPESLHDATGAVVESEEPGLVADSEMLLIHDLVDGSGNIQGRMEFLDTQCPNDPTDGIPLPDGLLAVDLTQGLRDSVDRPVPTADLDGDGVTEFALAFPGSSLLYLYGSNGALTCPLPAPYAAMPQIALPSGTSLSSLNVLFAHLDGAGGIDLLLPVYDDQARLRVMAARSQDGTFAPPAFVPELEALPVDFDEQRVPLAAADLDGNGLADYVMPRGIYLAIAAEGGPTELVQVAAARQAGWTDAEITDVNGDGALDVIATSSERGIDWLVNAGLIGPFVRFNRFLVDTASRPTHLRTGDFNGDQLSDVIALEELAGDLYDLTVVFSSPSGVPGEAVRSGRVRRPVWFIGPGQIPELNTKEIDGVTDLFILSDLGDGKSGIYALQGSTSQQLISPFLAFPLTPGPTADNPVVVAATVGDFLAEAADDPAERRRFIAAIAVPEAAFRGRPGGDDGVIDAPSSLVLLASSAAGELSQVSPPVRLGSLRELNARCALWLTGDLDDPEGEGAPRDELIAVESLRPCPFDTSDAFGGPPAIQILRLPSDSGPAPVAPASTIVQAAPDLADVSSARLVDLDGDRKRDLLLFGYTSEQQWVVTILWNDERCPASLCAEQSTRLSLPDYAPPVGEQPAFPPIGGDPLDTWRPVVDVVPVQVTGDARPELAVLYNGYGPNLLIFEATAEAPRALTSPSAAGSIPLELGYATSMSAGDVNGDGLDDLVVGIGDVTNVLWQQPAPALGAEPTPRAVEEPTP
jgi:hypothetical protein